MLGSRNTLDVAASSADDYFTMHGYWLQAPVVSQDSTILSDDTNTNSNSSVHAGRDRNGAGETMAPYYFPESMHQAAPPSRGPLVEDDEEEDTEAAGTRFEFFFNQSSNELCSRQTSGQRSSGAAAATISAGAVADKDAGNSSGEASPGAASEDDPVPVLEEESLGDLGDIIGYGGDRGSFVCRVKFPALLHVFQQRAPSFFSPLSLSSPPARDREAYKRYPTNISTEELSFVSTAYRCAGNSAHCQSVHSPLLSAAEAQYAALHLVLPDAIVTCGTKKVGLLMPLYNCSLKEFLQSFTPHGQDGALTETRSRPPSSFLDDTFSSEDTHRGAFNTVVKYRPVDSMEVVCCIAFQVLEAIAYLNHHLPHGESASGYTHNDLHLDNVLLSYSGDVALCDFELVASTPHTTHSGEVRRLPPSTRLSPHGLFSDTADTWAFGLLLTGLLTGVDPLFTNNIVNDFSDGPQLSRWDGGQYVLDWESNIREHVETLLLTQDPTGKRLQEAQEVLSICGKCLVNREGAEPLRAVDLLDEPLFTIYRKDFRLATQTIKAWIAEKRRQ